MDKARVELIQVKQENKGLQKSVAALRGSGEEMRRVVEGGEMEASGVSWENGNNNNKKPTINSPTNLITFKHPNS